MGTGRRGGRGRDGESPGQGVFHEEHLPPRARDLLAAYAGLVRRWAPRLDLVAPGDLERLELRHVADSLRLLPLVRSVPAGPAVDVGSGAGFPGIPLAIAEPSRLWRLLEPRRRRAAFLEEVVRALSLDCEVIALPAERAAGEAHLRATHTFAVARAVAPPARAFRLLAPLVAPAGVAAVFLGRARIPRGAEEWQKGVAIMRREGEGDPGGGP
jgi:16S rRNA (guanine527-N7)-methyltransferase